MGIGVHDYFKICGIHDGSGDNNKIYSYRRECTANLGEGLMIL